MENRDKSFTELEKLVQDMDHAYYNEDNSTVTDAEYDAIKEEYLSLLGKDEYETVPGSPSTIFAKVQHPDPVTSLAKVNSREELIKAMEPLMPVVIQPKFDGLTLVVYKDKIATRGNGSVGENVTHTAFKIEGMQHLAGRVDERPVRGEALMKLSDFRAINEDRVSRGLEPFKNPRNAAAGMIRNKDAEKVRGLTFFTYDLIGMKHKESLKLHSLMRLAFRDCRPTPFARFEDINEAVDYVMNYDREQHDYEIDGLVIKSDISDSLNVFGSTGHHPKNAVAYKFPAQGQWTTLRKVIWQVGRSGKVTPVAEFDSVEILGSTVSRATLHNISIINALNMEINGKILVVKANDVIPAIIKAEPTEASEAIMAIVSCPECGASLTQINDQHFCTNEDCRPQLAGRIVHLAKRDALDIEGLSEETAEKMIEAGLNNAFQVFEMTKEEIENLPGFAKKSAENLYRKIKESRYTDLDRFLYAAGIPQIGRTASKLLSKTFGSYEEIVKDIANGAERIEGIAGFGDIMVENLLDKAYLWEDLATHVASKSVEVKTLSPQAKQLTFVITGTFIDGGRKVKRDEIEEMILEAGHKASGSVSKKTDIVMAGEAAGSKLEKAQSLGIKIITSLDELKAIIG